MPGWDNQKAGTIFEQMLVKTSNKIDGVAAANDGLANAVVVALKARRAGADPAERPGCDRAGCPEHHLRLADDDGVEGRAEARRRIGHGRDRARQGPEAQPTTGSVKTKGRAPAGVHHPRRSLDHEGELQAALHTATRSGPKSATASTGSTARSDVDCRRRRPRGRLHSRTRCGVTRATVSADTDPAARASRGLEELRLGAGARPTSTSRSVPAR